MKTGISKLEEECEYIRRSGILATIGGSAGPISKNNYFHWYGISLVQKILLIWADYFI